MKQSKNIVTKSNSILNKETENNYLHTHDFNKTKRDLYSNILKNNIVPNQAGKQLSNKTNIRKSQLINLISEILKTEENPPSKSVFKFENTKQASKHNAKILKTFDYDYEMVLEKQKGTNIYHGSEFRY